MLWQYLSLLLYLSASGIGSGRVNQLLILNSTNIIKSIIVIFIPYKNLIEMRNILKFALLDVSVENESIYNLKAGFKKFSNLNWQIKTYPSLASFHNFRY